MLVEAAARAGLEPIELLPEPQAAAIMYAEFDSSNAPVAVYDLGAGTFDVSVVEATEDGARVVGSPRGIDPLGGLTFDQKLFDLIEERFKIEQPSQWASLSQPSNSTEFAARFSLDLDIRTAKEALSENNAWEIPVLGTEFLVTREDLEDLIRPEVERSVQLTLEVIASAGLEPADLGGIYMVGGASRVPLVKNMLYDALGVQPRTELDPKTVVALGGLRWLAGRSFEPGISEASHTDELAPTVLIGLEGGTDETNTASDYASRAVSDGDELGASVPGRSTLGSLAAIFLLGAAIVGVISVLPQFADGGVLRSDEASRTFLYLAISCTWIVSAACLRSRQAVVLMVGAFFTAGATVSQVGSPLTLLGSASPKLGFWLIMISFGFAIAGVCLGFVAVSRIGLLGAPGRLSSDTATPDARAVVGAILALTALLAITFLLPWEGTGSLSRTLDVSLNTSFGSCWTALWLALAPIAALVWRPSLAGMALLVGLLLTEMFFVIAAAIFHTGNIWMYLQIVSVLGLAVLFGVLSRIRRNRAENADAQPGASDEIVGCELGPADT